MESRSIFLRAFEPEDYVLINKWRNDYQLQKLTCGTFRYVSSEREKEWVKNQMMNNLTNMYFAVCVNDESKKMIGYASLNNINHLFRSAYFGGTVIGDPEYHNGIAWIEMFLLVMEYAFDQLNINRLDAEALTEHQQSMTILDVMYYKVEGIKRQAVYKNGRYYDEALVSILRDEYYEHKNNGDYDFSSILARFAEITRKNKKKNA